MRKLSLSQMAHARIGLRALVGSPFRIKQIEEGKDGLICPVCRLNNSPRISPNGNIHCGECKSWLYDGDNDKVLK